MYRKSQERRLGEGQVQVCRGQVSGRGVFSLWIMGSRIRKGFDQRRFVIIFSFQEGYFGFGMDYGFGGLGRGRAVSDGMGLVYFVIRKEGSVISFQCLVEVGKQYLGFQSEVGVDGQFWMELLFLFLGNFQQDSFEGQGSRRGEEEWVIYRSFFFRLLVQRF